MSPQEPSDRVENRAGPLVSVIMNGFNSARYLRESIDSLLAQTHDNWEMIFWDNQSTDDCESIVRSYADARIQFHAAPHRMTLAEGRNSAMNLARGEWIAFLDCDDLWGPDKLARQLARLARDGSRDVGLVYARAQSFSERGDEGETTYRYAGRTLPEGHILGSLLREGNLIPIVSAMISREARQAVGDIPKEFTFAEDYWLFVAIAARFRVLCVQETCCHYRVHDGSATSQNKLASHTETLRVLDLWGHELHPRELRSRRAVYHTLIGLERVRSQGALAAGLREILLHGSLAFLLRGAVTHLFRRHIRRQRSYS